VNDPSLRAGPDQGAGRIGTTVADKYRIVRSLGRGGMGAVYLAVHSVLERRVAIKFLRADLADDAEMVARFRREAQAAGRLEHENIVSVIDFGVTPEGAPYLVMEFLDGSNLAEVIEGDGPLTVPRAVTLVVQACRGVGAAHARDIIHRDLKPANLFVCVRDDGSEQVKVLDFGIAKLRSSAGSGGATTGTGASFGTPDYMSPEQARGERQLDQRTDIYSLGAVLYELLTATKPHSGETYNEILHDILTRAPTPITELRAGLPDGLSSVIERAMAEDREMRFASASELVTALLPFTRLEDSRPARTARSGVSTDCGAQTVRARPIERSVPSRHGLPGLQTVPRWRARRLVAWLTALLLAAGMIGWALWSRAPSGGAPVPAKASARALPEARPEPPALDRPRAPEPEWSVRTEAPPVAARKAARARPPDSRRAASAPAPPQSTPAEPAPVPANAQRASKKPSRYDSVNPYRQ
jgi:eukaryotic-like serine/threonine-protein kinase